MIEPSQKLGLRSGPEQRPVAVPVARSNNDANYQLVASETPIRAGNTSRTAAALLYRPRVGRQGLLRVGEGLSERDWAVLRTVATHRFLTTRQLEGFHFTAHATPLSAARTCRRVLHRLHDSRLLNHLDRRVGGVRAGSASFVWTIGPVGDRLLRLEDIAGTRQRRREPSERWLQHCLAVADAHLALIRADRAGQLELLHVDLEPDCWQHFLGLGGARLVLQPDLAVVTGVGEFEDHWFVEIDLGTEHLPTLLRKCHHYEAYRRSGTAQRAGGVFPLVVWVMPNIERTARLQAALEAQRDIAAELFRVTTADGFVALVAGGTA